MRMRQTRSKHGQNRLPPGDRRQHSYLVAIGHRLRSGDWLAVEPHPANLKLLCERGPVTINCGGQDLVHSGAGHFVSPGAGRLPDVREQAQRGHDESVRESFATATVRKVTACTVKAVSHLLLIRHAQSEWNALRRWQGQADPPLSELGRQQAAAAAARIEPVDVVATSTLQRSRASAEIIAEAMGCEPPILVPELIERDVREFSGLTRVQIEERFPGFLEDGRRPPGWEQDDALLARVLAGLNRLAGLVGNRTAVVVTHGGVIYSLEAHLGYPPGRNTNMSGRWVTVANGQLVAGERVHPLEGVDIQTPVSDLL